MRNESPTVSSLSRLMKSLALDMVRACNIIVAVGPTTTERKQLGFHKRIIGKEAFLVPHIIYMHLHVGIAHESWDFPIISATYAPHTIGGVEAFALIIAHHTNIIAGITRKAYSYTSMTQLQGRTLYIT